jgi:hypothetical protein
MKIRPVGAELFNADGRTDRHDEANSGFSRLGTYGNNHCRPRLQEQQEITEANEHRGKIIVYRAGNCNGRNNNTLSKVTPLYSSEHLYCCNGPITIEDINSNINESTERVNTIMRRFGHHSIQKCTGKTRGTKVHSR